MTVKVEEFKAPNDPVAALYTEEFMRDPRPLFHWLRSNDPIHRAKDGYVLLSRYRDAHKVVMGAKFRRPSVDDLAAVNPSVAEHLSLRLFMSTLGFQPPLDNRRLRKIVSQDLTFSRVSALVQPVVNAADVLLTGVEDRLRDGEAVDLHDELSMPIARMAMGDLLGMPEADRKWMAETILKLLEATEHTHNEANLKAADEATNTVLEYFRSLMEERRKSPHNDLVSAWAVPGEHAERFRDDDELITMMFAMWLAGFVSTVSGVDHCLLVAAQHPELNHMLRGGADQMQAYVDEVVRYEPQVLITAIPWLATEDFELSGEVLPAGSDMRVLVGAANHDPEVYPDPDRFDPGRAKVPSFTFYQGAHYCLGAALARMEMSAVLERTFARFPGIALAGPVERVPAFSLRAIGSLRIVLTK